MDSQRRACPASASERHWRERSASPISGAVVVAASSSLWCLGPHSSRATSCSSRASVTRGPAERRCLPWPGQPAWSDQSDAWSSACSRRAPHSPSPDVSRDEPSRPDPVDTFASRCSRGRLSCTQLTGAPAISSRGPGRGADRFGRRTIRPHTGRSLQLSQLRSWSVVGAAWCSATVHPACCGGSAAPPSDDRGRSQVWRISTCAAFKASHTVPASRPSCLAIRAQDQPCS